MLSVEEKKTIRSEFVERYISVSVLAERFSVSRMAIYKILKKLGVDTTKRRYEVRCESCGEITLKPRCQIRMSNTHFCSRKCYKDWLNRDRNNYIQYRHGQRIARKIVGRYHPLRFQEIVHHEDRNNRNNVLGNLKVFKDQGDHVRYHRGFDVEPVWSGQDVIERRKKS